MKNETGFTLIEVLVSMLILSVGLLGLAGLQATSLRNNLSSHHRSQATQLAYDMADRMRANVADAGNFGTSVYITMVPSDAVVQGACTTTAGCSTTLMAQQDLFEWNQAINAILPNGQGTITEVGGLFTITMNWDDDRDANDPNFIMRFQL